MKNEAHPERQVGLVKKNEKRAILHEIARNFDCTLFWLGFGVQNISTFDYWSIIWKCSKFEKLEYSILIMTIQERTKSNSIETIFEEY